MSKVPQSVSISRLMSMSGDEERQKKKGTYNLAWPPGGLVAFDHDQQES